MNEKLSIQNLIELLAEKHGMNKEDAGNFVKEFFQLIEESLEHDKYVKIRGLGTFKLINVESRESVSISTGERFQIQGHTKVSFTPEPSLKDIINKPFSHFETVALNDETVLEDTPVDAASEEEVENREEEESIENTPEKQDVAPIDEPAEAPEVNIPADETPMEAPEEIAEAAEEEMDVVEEPAESIKVETDNSEKSTMKFFIGIVVFIVILCVGAVIFMYYPDLSDKMRIEPAENEVVEPADDASAVAIPLTDSIIQKDTSDEAKTDTVAESIAEKPAVASTEVVPAKPAAKEKVSATATKDEKKKSVAVPFQPDSVSYQIVGTKTTYTIKEGETLTKVALRFYGTKVLWPYIVKHNPGVIKNPDNVPFGTVIKIPELVKK